LSLDRPRRLGVKGAIQYQKGELYEGTKPYEREGRMLGDGKQDRGCGRRVRGRFRYVGPVGAGGEECKGGEGGLKTKRSGHQEAEKINRGGARSQSAGEGEKKRERWQGGGKRRV